MQLDNTPRAPKCIAFYRAGFIGDNVIALRALYALCTLYKQTRIVVYTNTEGMQIFGKLSGVECIDSSAFSKSKLIAHINSYAFEYFLLTQPNRWRCALVSATNAKTIITFATLSNIWNKRFKKVLFSRAFSRIPYHKALMQLVRSIDAKHYDSSKDSLHPTKPFPIDVQGVACIEAFLASITQSGTTPAKNLKLILFNPFVRSTATNLPLESYITLVSYLAKQYTNYLFVLISFEGAPKILAPELPNVAVFHNNNNLANLIELIRASNLLVSPSTGAIHIADMLGVPVVGIYSPKDMRLWLGETMRKDQMVVLQKPLAKMSHLDIQVAFQATYEQCVKTITWLQSQPNYK